MSKPLHVTFICSANVARSPMAERMFAYQIRERGLDSAVRLTSAGTHGERYVASGAADSVRRVLASHGYPAPRCPVQLSADHLSADLVVALAGKHVRILLGMVFRLNGSASCGRLTRDQARKTSMSPTRSSSPTSREPTP